MREFYVAGWVKGEDGRQLWFDYTLYADDAQAALEACQERQLGIGYKQVEVNHVCRDDYAAHQEGRCRGAKDD